MTFTEEHGDLFAVDFKKWTPAHCISVDCKMGAGIAVPMKKKFRLSGLYKLDSGWKPGISVYHNGVYNLMTKSKYYNKPTYDTLKASLIEMRNHAVENDVENIVMPKIGSGLDRLSWPKVREIIKQVFEDTKINILVRVM